jgi:hypothetical protein
MKRVLPLMLPLCVACQDSKEASYALPTNAEIVESARAIRLDVYPPGNLGLLPQSFTVPPDTLDDVYLGLAPTVSLDGSVFGTLPSPVDITIPSEEAAPVEARITFEIPNTVMRATTTSDASGAFTVDVPAGVGYRAVAVALDPLDLPLYVEESVPFIQDDVYEIDMGLGIPVSGEALQSDGSTLPAGSRVRLFDNETGESGPEAALSPEGAYLVRALPGEYTLVLDGATGSSMPSVPFALSVEEDDPFIRADLTPGTVPLGAVSGSVVNQDGRPIDDAEVRFSAVSLVDLPADATAEVSTDTDRNGIFTRQLAQGTWQLEVIPAYAPTASLSPTTLLIDVTTETVNIGSVTLMPRASLDARIMIGTQPARNIVVTAEEQGFNRYTYSATSDQDGWVHLDVPNVPLDLTLQSPDPEQPITRIEVPFPGDVSRVDLDDEGSLVAGTLLDSEAVPLPYALIEIRDAEGALLGITLTDAGGEFRVTVALIEEFELDTAD